ncbi:MAG: alpha/beta hydrolase, partial [Nocardioidaceae bacterium]
ELFPRRVGRFVLDGAVDPTLSATKAGLQQVAGFQTALEAYVDDCVASGGCPLGSDRSEAIERLRSFFDDLDQSPLDTGDPKRPLTEALGFIGVVAPLYNQDYWPLLSEALSAAFQGDGSVLLRVVDAYLRSEDGRYNDNMIQVGYAVRCLDDPAYLTPQQIRRSVPRYEQASPVFGRIFAWSQYGCSAWPIRPEQPTPVIDAAGAAPIVVIGTTRDPATPYAGAEALADALRSGVLVSRDGDGHTGYHMGNDCVDHAIDAYLVDGTVPEDGLSC